MDKELIDGYVKLPYDNNRFIHWIGENELEMIEKKIIHISNEIIADESIDIIKYVEDKIKSETDHYKQQRDELSKKLDKECNDNYKLEGQLHDMTKQRDSLIKDVEKLRGALIKTQNLADELMDIQVKYMNLTEHIKDKAIHNPSVSRYIDLVHFIDDLEKERDQYE